MHWVSDEQLQSTCMATTRPYVNCKKLVGEREAQKRHPGHDRGHRKVFATAMRRKRKRSGEEPKGKKNEKKTKKNTTFLPTE